MVEEPPTPAQIRAARALLGWSQVQLAGAARVGLSTVKEAEVGKRDPMTQNILSIRRTLEGAGVEFLAGDGHGPGVRFKTDRPAIVRRPFRIPEDDTFGFLVRWKGKRHLVEIEKSALDLWVDPQDIETERYFDVFRRQEDRILDVAAHHIDASILTTDHTVRLKISDFKDLT